MNELKKLTDQELNTDTPTDDQILAAMIMACSKYLGDSEDAKLNEFIGRLFDE